MSDRRLDLKFDADTLGRMRALWEAGELTAAEIGERFGMTKNAAIGQAHRRGWQRRTATAPSQPPEPSGLFRRMDALDAALNQVLAETKAAVEADRAKRAGDARRAAA